jgi:hypothetical protein
MMNMVLGQGQISIALLNLEQKKLRFIPEKYWAAQRSGDEG